METDWTALVTEVLQAAMQRADVLDVSARTKKEIDWAAGNLADERIVAAVVALRSAAMDHAVSEWERLSRKAPDVR